MYPVRVEEAIVTLNRRHFEAALVVYKMCIAGLSPKGKDDSFPIVVNGEEVNGRIHSAFFNFAGDPTEVLVSVAELDKKGETDQFVVLHRNGGTSRWEVKQEIRTALLLNQIVIGSYAQVETEPDNESDVVPL